MVVFDTIQESIEMRKEFLAYILSFNDNESYQLPSEISELIKDLPEGRKSDQKYASSTYCLEIFCL